VSVARHTALGPTRAALVAGPFPVAGAIHTVSFSLSSATLILSGLAPTLWVLLVVMMVLGVANGALNTLVATLLLTRLPRERLGSGLATMNGLARAAAAVALGLGGLAGGLFGPRPTFVGSGVVALAVTLVAGVRVRSAAPSEAAAPLDGATAGRQDSSRSVDLRAPSSTG
jgi:predicted MFS family arabinose efflux permease